MTDEIEEKNAAVIKDRDSAEGETKMLRCPKCGKSKNKTFYVTTKITHDIDVALNRECEIICADPEDVEWKETSPTKCIGCGYKGQFKEFVDKEED